MPLRRQGIPAQRIGLNRAGDQQSPMGARGRAVVHQKVPADRIAHDVRSVQARRKTSVPPDLLVQHGAATFTLVLNWWVEAAPFSRTGPARPRGGFAMMLEFE